MSTLDMSDESIIVGFDLDGVIIDHTQNKIRVANRYGIMLRPEDTHSEKMAKFVSPKIYHEIQEQIYDDTDEALSAPLMAGAYSGLARLSECGIPLFLISRRKKPVHALHLLERRGLWGNVFTPENTFFVEKMDEKDPVAERLGITHFVDDETRVLDLMPSVAERILFDNRDLFSDSPKFHRVKNWSELETKLGIANS